MKIYQKFATATLATVIALSPVIASAKENSHKVKAQSEVKVERIETDHGFFQNFWLPFGIWKKIVHNNASTTATSTKPHATSTPAVEARKAIMTNLMNFFKNLTASTTYSINITATDSTGHATTSALGSFTK